MKSELSFNDIRDLLSQALGSISTSAGSGMASYCYIRDVFNSYLVYQDEASNSLYKRSYVIDDKNVVTLGDPSQVVEVTEYEPVEMAAFSLLDGEFSESEDGDMVIIKGKIFEAGNYPDKNFSLSPEEMANAVKNFKPVDLDYAHVKGPLDGKLGQLRAVEVAENGKDLFGTVAIPKWLDSALGAAARKVSCTWDRITKELDKLALVNNPRVPDAVLMAAFAQFETETNKSITTTPTVQEIIPMSVDSTNPNPNPEVKPVIVDNSAEFSALQAKLKAQNAMIEELKNTNRQKDAAALAEVEIKAGRAYPASRANLVAVFEQALKDDEREQVTVSFSEDGTKSGSRTDALKALMAAAPAHNLTAETVKVVDGQILFSNSASASSKDQEATDKEQAEVDRMLAATPQGQKALAARKAAAAGK